MGQILGVSSTTIDKRIDKINKFDNPMYLNDQRKAIDFMDFSNIIDEMSFKETSKKLSNDFGLKLLQENNINYDKDEIRSVESVGNKTVVTMKNGEVFTFIEENGDYKLSTINLSDGTVIYCNLADNLQEQIRANGYISKDIPVNGYAVIDVNGKKIPAYWIGDDVDFETFKNNVYNIKEGMEKYPQNVLDYVTSNANFYGFYVGTFDSIPDYDSTADASVIAFAYTNEYIYINADHYASLTTDTIEHEFAHILDYTLGNGDHWNSEGNIIVNILYCVYKQLIQQIPLTGYPASGFPDGVPDSTEFFAQAVAAYLEYPEDLEALMPEVYDYIDNLLNNL